MPRITMNHSISVDKIVVGFFVISVTQTLMLRLTAKIWTDCNYCLTTLWKYGRKFASQKRKSKLSQPTIHFKEIKLCSNHNSILFEVHVFALQFTIFKLSFWGALNIFEVPVKPALTYYFQIKTVFQTISGWLYLFLQT